MKEQRRLGHTVSWFTAHIVWATKYRYYVLKGYIQVRCNDLINQICDSEDIRIPKGVISKGLVDIHIEYGPFQDIINIVNVLKVEHFEDSKKSLLILVKDIVVNIFGQLDMEFGVQEILQMKWYKSTLRIIKTF